jgi:phosphohistidine swiveling domain-containing protein
MLCKPLHEELDPELVGAKAYNLSGMIRQGLPVPRGYVIESGTFHNFRMEKFSLEDKLAAELEQISRELGGVRLMVRSSAVGEDSAEASFAGQLDSFISEPGTADLMENVRRCWQSYSKENVKVYQERTGVKLKGMGVVIQQLVDPDYAGVLFTRSMHREGQMMAEFVEGHGEKLVSGKVNPNSFHCSRSDGSIDTEIPFSFDGIYRSALQLEKYFGHALDIEWLISGGRPFIVQSRPVTTPRIKKVFWSNTNVNENYPSPITPLLYSIARESYYHYFRNLAGFLQVSRAHIQRLESSFSNVIGIAGCRMYYNMSSIHSIISASPFSRLMQKSFDNFVGYQGETEIKAGSITLGNKIRFAAGFVRLNISFNRNVKDFEARAISFREKCNSAKNAEELKECFHAFIEIRMHSWYKASFADFFAMIYHGMLGLFCKRFYPGTHEGIRNRLIQAIPGLVSSKPISETWKIARLIKANPKLAVMLQEIPEAEFLEVIESDPEHWAIKDAMHKFMQDWGFRCSGELMLTEPTYAEQPVKYIQLLKQYTRQPQQDPELLIAAKYMERKEVFRQFRKTIFKKRGLLFPLAMIETGILRILVNLCSAGISGRERVRLKQAMLYYHFKLVLQKAGREFSRKNLIANADDIFFLKYQEVAENFSASDMLPEQLKVIIKLRKEQFEKSSSREYPDDFSTVAGNYAMEKKPVHADPNGESSNTLKGLSACGGQVTGRARVLESVMDAHRIEAGDILVTRQTDPGWACVFPLISGLLVERGGMLSHGAIVAREFGIPAIVGIEQVTQIIADGEMITLDADTGKVYRNV